MWAGSGKREAGSGKREGKSTKLFSFSLRDEGTRLRSHRLVHA
jgi:hypothetical protein